MLIVVYCVVLLVIMYFLSIRPTEERRKKLAELRNAIEVGDSIITNSGFYGGLLITTYDTLIVEFGLNRGIRILLRKQKFSVKQNNMSNKAPPVEKNRRKKGLFRRG